MMQKIKIHPFCIMALFAGILLWTGCQKHNLLGEDRMWRILSKGSGIWEVKLIEDFSIDSLGNLTMTDSQEPVNVQYYFYESEFVVFGEIIPTHFLSITEQPADSDFGNRWDYRIGIDEVENRRIYLEESFDQFLTYTISEGGKKEQVWERYDNIARTRRVIHLQKCNSCKPHNINQTFEESDG